MDIKRVRLFIRRLCNRFKSVLRFREMWEWEMQTCSKCGCLMSTSYNVKDSLWNKYSGFDKGDGCLCLDCFLVKMRKAGINYDDIEHFALITDVNNCTIKSDNKITEEAQKVIEEKKTAFLRSIENYKKR